MCDGPYLLFQAKGVAKQTQNLQGVKFSLLSSLLCKNIYKMARLKIICSWYRHLRLKSILAWKRAFKPFDFEFKQPNLKWYRIWKHCFIIALQVNCNLPSNKYTRKMYTAILVSIGSVLICLWKWACLPGSFDWRIRTEIREKMHSSQSSLIIFFFQEYSALLRQFHERRYHLKEWWITRWNLKQKFI